MKLFIPWMPPSFNVIWQQGHWSKRKQIRDTGHLACIDMKRSLPVFENPIAITIEPVQAKGRFYDIDNYALAGKIVLDSMVHYGRIPDDRNKFVNGLRYKPPVRGQETGLWITIEEEVEDAENKE